MRDTPRTVSESDLPGLVRPGESIYLAGGVTLPAAFVDALQRDQGHSRDLRMTTILAPGVPVPFDFSALHPGAQVTGLFMHPGLRKAHQDGRYRLLPMSFGGFLRHLQTQEFDLGVIQVSPPDQQGRCSLGPSVEFTPSALPRCRRLLAIVNPGLPSLPFSPSVPLDAFRHVCTVERSLPEHRVDCGDAERAIAGHIAPLIGDGATVQSGVGKVPTALAQALRGHRGLRIHSGMVSDGLMDLARAGALDPGAHHVACVAAGSASLYEWLQGDDCRQAVPRLRLVGCAETHGPIALASLERFVAVNSALEVDLLGQCNLEHARGRAVSGAGGAPDFARAARVSPSGLSIVALNASTSDGLISRIVPSLDRSTVTSLARVDVDLVVTEYGMADLRDASVHERARALIGIAPPTAREELSKAWALRAASL